MRKIRSAIRFFLVSLLRNFLLRFLLNGFFYFINAKCRIHSIFYISVCIKGILRLCGIVSSCISRRSLLLFFNGIVFKSVLKEVFWGILIFLRLISILIFFRWHFVSPLFTLFLMYLQLLFQIWILILDFVHL